MQLIAFWLIFSGLVANVYLLLRWLFSKPKAEPTEEELSSYQKRAAASARTICRVGYQNSVAGEVLDIDEVRTALFKVSKWGDDK